MDYMKLCDEPNINPQSIITYVMILRGEVSSAKSSCVYTHYKHEIQDKLCLSVSAGKFKANSKTFPSVMPLGLISSNISKGWH